MYMRARDSLNNMLVKNIYSVCTVVQTGQCLTLLQVMTNNEYTFTNMLIM